MHFVLFIFAVRNICYLLFFPHFFCFLFFLFFFFSFSIEFFARPISFQENRILLNTISRRDRLGHVTKPNVCIYFRVRVGGIFFFFWCFPRCFCLFSDFFFSRLHAIVQRRRCVSNAGNGNCHRS